MTALQTQIRGELERFKQAGASLLTVHYEACSDLHRTIGQIRSLGMKAGVSINPETPAHVLKEIIPSVDLVLVMSVHPGFGGQKFIPETLQKICEVRRMITQSNSSALIEVDGGIGLQNAADVIAMGADALVAGASIFSTENPLETIENLKKVK